VTVTAVTLRDCNNGPVAGSPGAPATITIDNTTPAAVTDLSAAQRTSGNGAGSTTGIILSWATGGAGSVALYRAPFGTYPEYDDDGAVPPPNPALAPGGPWTLVNANATSPYTDAAAARGFWYYAALITDACGNVSAVSNMTGGTLNYLLGDVVPGAGDNKVDGLDISALGFSYGLSGELAVDAVGYLDVGPTLTGAPTARPTPDDKLNFEDLIIFAINYGGTGFQAPPAAAIPVAAGSDALSLEAPASVSAGETFTVALHLRGAGDLQGLSTQLDWDAVVAEPLAVEAGALISGQGGVVLSATPGSVDAALLGPGRTFSGEGVLATLAFRARASGDPRLMIVQVDARDAANRKVAIASAQPQTPRATTFAAPAPNPFDRATALSFSLAQGGPVELAIFAIDGRRVRTLVKESRAAGVYQLSWDGADDAGRAVPAGLFYARLLTPQGRFNRTVVRVK
jgi:hypothetical protein